MTSSTLLDRRDLLVGAGAASVGLLSPRASADAADGPLLGQVARLRQLRREVIGATLTRVGWTADAAPPPVLAVAHPLASLAVLEGVSRVPVDEQVHPAMQALIAEELEALGAHASTLEAALEEVAEGPTELAPARLDAALRDARVGVAGAPVAAASWGLNDAALEGIGDRLRRHGLRSEARRAARRLAKARRLGARLAAAETGVLSSADARLQRGVRAGQRRWGVSEAPPEAPEPRRSRRVLGMVLSGLAVLVGGVLVIAAIVCLVDCGGGLVPLLLGAALCAAGVWGLRRLPPPPAPTDDTLPDDVLDDLPGG